jgi:hypothetical protein
MVVIGLLSQRRRCCVGVPVGNLHFHDWELNASALVGLSVLRTLRCLSVFFLCDPLFSFFFLFFSPCTSSYNSFKNEHSSTEIAYNLTAGFFFMKATISGPILFTSFFFISYIGLITTHKTPHYLIKKVTVARVWRRGEYSTSTNVSI